MTTLQNKRGNNASAASDSPIHVTIAPSQSSYFAGETFSVTITFTNTHSPDVAPNSSTISLPRTASYTHKRGSHSISSAPLARPPTSPGMPRTPFNPPTHVGRRLKPDVEIPLKKGLIGKHLLIPSPRVFQDKQDKQSTLLSKRKDDLPELLEQRRKKLLAKSLSVSISPSELEAQLPEGTLVKSKSTTASLNMITESQSSQPSSSNPSAVTTTNPSPVLESPYTSIASSPSDSPVDPMSSIYVYPPDSPGQTLPIGLGPPPKPALSNRPLPPPLQQSQPHSPPITHQQRQSLYYQHPRSAASSTFAHPDTELILYAYAQLTGSLTLLPHPFLPLAASKQTQTLRSLRSTLLKRSVIGGGSMDITPSLQTSHMPKSSLDFSGSSPGHLTGNGVGGGASRPPRPRVRITHTHSRSPSLATGFFSTLLSPTTPTPTSPSPVSPLAGGTPFASYPASLSSAGIGQASGMRSASTSSSRAPSHRTSASVSIPISATLPQVQGFHGLEVPEVEVDPEMPLPTFEVQPAMLAVDLSLMPGQSRSYTYSIKLPDVLPPTFKGRSLRFSYELTVGVCRTGTGGGMSVSSPPTLGSSNGVSRVMKVPIRVYNYVTVGRVPRPYDLLWPVGRRIQETAVAVASRGGVLGGSQGQGKGDLERGLVIEEGKAEVRAGGGGGATVPLPLMDNSGGETLEDFRRYARRMVEVSLASKRENGGAAMKSVEGEKSQDSEEDREEERIGCREAVEILTRNPKKVSYDVNKEGVTVAVLTFVKSAYRLGETVLGVVEFNERRGRSRVLQMSAMLEAHERLPSSISSLSDSTPLKRTHAEHHQSFLAATLRTSFVLDIPSDASPAFQVGVGGEDDVLGGLEWRVRLCLLVAVVSEDASEGTEGVRVKGMERDGERGVWGSSWTATESVAPMEKREGDMVVAAQVEQSVARNGGEGGVYGWASYFASKLLGSGTTEEVYHDGDDLSEGDSEEYDGIKADPGGGVGKGVNYGGGEEGWKEVKVEMVECEVPIRVWAGNTAFKAVEVVFDL
ncbi:hypothetical protein AMATHDRAFT_68853 [Amanita thiersii Skay4041]|uniref:Rgp1-domain-containing protein n=1 Tax=Amanita thiersii Skay4041 TaxID=703135 RepID=A0A2A9N8U4_9AGAR|nr:hypothetical protein AMATHDRAFT_68853 [Amanita thiersii Skay4041]